MECKWLPELMLYEDYPSWPEYEAALYDVFKNDFVCSHPQFEGKNVNIRRHPMEFGKEEAFFHVTCKDYHIKQEDTRDPDFRRCERIRWIRKFIEHYDCNLEECADCEGMKVWEEDARNNNRRVHILLEEEKYHVVIERRKEYCLLITAFYVDYNHSMEKLLKKYRDYEKQKALHKGETPSGTPSTTSR